MAVTAGGTSLDHALDRAARVQAHPPCLWSAAMHVAAWREVARHALLEDQVDVLIVAVREWMHWRGVLDAAPVGAGM